MAPPPVVTGLSPNEGLPGTRITIRGENFGSKPTDLIGLSICGFDCLLSAEWKSPNKIIAISGPVKGKGDVIVTTRLGGVGTCNVTFKGYHETIGPMKESAVWVEETTPLFVWGRHSLSPSSYQQEDPLGLSVEGNDKKFPEDDLMTYFPDKSGDIASGNFSPGWFLLENHHATSFNDLQAGLNFLRRKVEGQKEGQLSFLKANIGSVMDQIDTLVNLKEKIEADVAKFGTEPTLKLEKSIKESEREGRKLFDDVLARRDRAEKTRNALNVLARFRFLFCLPCVIDRNIKKGEYDIVINDYIRVKNLFNKTDVPIFKSALNEVDKRIADLKKKLLTDLQTMPITVEQQKRLIRYLVNLDCTEDPAWRAIESRSAYINKNIKQIYGEHNVEKPDPRSKSNSTSKYSKYNPPPQNDLNTVPANVNFIDEICLSISETFPDLWKIGQAYFSGELRVKIEPGRHVEFKHIVMTIMESFCKSIRSSLIPNTLDKADKSALGSWTIPELEEVAPFLPEILRCVRSTYIALIKLDLPSEALDIVSSLLLDLRIHCMSTLFKQAAEQIKQLNENWKIDFSGNHVGITELPIKFERIIQDVIQIVKESVLSTEQRETPLLENPTAHKELDKQIEAVLVSFHNVLNNLSSDESCDDDEDTSPVVSQLIGTPINGYRTNYTNNNMPIWEHRLLITLSNCLYAKNVVFDTILRKFKESGFPAPETPVKNAKDKLDVLEKTILEKYLEQKSDPLVGTIEPSMYLGRFDWDIEITPNNIRPYAKECINNVIHVHSEVNSISSSLLESVLPQVVLTIAEELYRLMSCVQKFSKGGAQQARADISALQIFFDHYSTPKARSYFQEALDIIPPLENSEATVVQDILRQCRARMRIQLLCLTSHANGPVKKRSH
ncbi:exocyst complex component 2 [Tribolium castaneum]|uniref:exocyst complex component 2 n=1 Tax=Tribolium castaneum TaxID=7070 RepID=UPI0030FECF5F